jgi:hypothetical protein
MARYRSRYINDGHSFCANCKNWVSEKRRIFCFSGSQRARFGDRALCDKCEAELLGGDGYAPAHVTMQESSIAMHPQAKAADVWSVVQASNEGPGKGRNGLGESSAHNRADRIADAVNLMASRMGIKAPEIATVAKKPPCELGVDDGKIYVDRVTCSMLTRDELEAAMAHELAHSTRRGKILVGRVAPMAMVALAMAAKMPVWILLSLLSALPYAFWRLARHEELMADRLAASAVGGSTQYREALLGIARKTASTKSRRKMEYRFEALRKG